LQFLKLGTYKCTLLPLEVAQVAVPSVGQLPDVSVFPVALIVQILPAALLQKHGFRSSLEDDFPGRLPPLLLSMQSDLCNRGFHTKKRVAGTYVAALIKWNNWVPTISSKIKLTNNSRALLVPNPNAMCEARPAAKTNTKTVNA
jgi:hypothetical protein